MKKKILIILSLSLSFFMLIFSIPKINRTDIKLDDYIYFSTHKNVDGSVCQSYQFFVNTNKINSLSRNKMEELDFKANLIENIKIIRNECLLGIAVCYLTNPKEEYKINQGVILSDVVYNSTSDSVTFDIVYTSCAAWDYYHQSAEKENGNDNKFYYTYKHTSRGSFPFSTEVTRNGEKILLGKYYQDLYLKSAKALSFYQQLQHDYSPSFVYDYISPYNKLSSNAEVVYTSASFSHHHMWVVENQSLSQDNEIEISIRIVNKGLWLATLLVGVLIIVFIVFLAPKLKFKKITKK